LSLTFAPPRIATNGRGGCAIVSPRNFSSRESSSPATQGLGFIAVGSASMLASLRWLAPKASLQ
jgi:hypothetical protein